MTLKRMHTDVFGWGTSVSPSTNGPVDGGAKSAQYGAVVGPIFTTLL